LRAEFTLSWAFIPSKEISHREHRGKKPEKKDNCFLQSLFFIFFLCVLGG
jgi:hypothetical protein